MEGGYSTVARVVGAVHVTTPAWAEAGSWCSLGLAESQSEPSAGREAKGGSRYSDLSPLLHPRTSAPHCWPNHLEQWAREPAMWSLGWSRAEKGVYVVAGRGASGGTLSENNPMSYRKGRLGIQKTQVYVSIPCDLDSDALNQWFSNGGVSVPRRTADNVDILGCHHRVGNGCY